MATPRRFLSTTEEPGSREPHPSHVPRSQSVPEVPPRSLSVPDVPPSSLRLIEDDLTCSICYNLFEEPKDLNCPHVFCFACIQKWARNQPTVECPECRRVTLIPSGGLDHLRTNLRLKNMVEKYAAHGMKRRSEAFGVPRCEKHKGESRHFFCETCEIKVCQACLVVDHPRPEHQIKNFSDVVKSKKAEAERLLRGAERMFKTYEENQASLLEASQQIRTSVEFEHAKIDQRIRAIIFDATAKGDAMKLHVTRNFERQTEQIQEQISNIGERHQHLKEVHAKTRKTLVETENQDYVDKHKALMHRLQAALDTKKQQSSTSPCIFHTGPSIAESILLGQLTVPRRLQLVAEFGRGSCKKAQGIASTADGVIAVADSTCGRVSTHRFKHGKFDRINCLGTSKDPPGKLINPSDVAVGSEDKFYVTDRSKSVVNIYYPTGHLERSFSTTPVAKEERSKAPPPTQSGIPACVASAPNGSVVVGESNRNTITVHSPCGDLQRTLHIAHQDITQIATNGRQIAYVKTDLGKVVVIDFESGRYLLDIDCPNATASCFDDHSGSLLVAKAGIAPGKGEIHQYCLTTKERLSCLADDLFMPLALTITPNGKLAVADCSSVKVYNLI